MAHACRRHLQQVDQHYVCSFLTSRFWSKGAEVQISQCYQQSICLFGTQSRTQSPTAAPCRHRACMSATVSRTGACPFASEPSTCRLWLRLTGTYTCTGVRRANHLLGSVTHHDSERPKGGPTGHSNALQESDNGAAVRSSQICPQRPLLPVRDFATVPKRHPHRLCRAWASHGGFVTRTTVE